MATQSKTINILKRLSHQTLFYPRTRRHSSNDEARESISNDGECLLSDEQLEHYGKLFEQLNAQYSLTIRHHFMFEDFLTCPDAYELAIHRYFANAAFLASRREGSTIHLLMYLRHPDILMASVSVDEAYRQSEAVKAEQLLPKQLAAIQKIDLAEMAWFQELIMQTFEQHHRVLLRGGAYVEPNTHYHRCERKQAGGKRR